ncbi:hypothetical protein DSECCO2_551980 [anaerobic digester metagenome]
MDKTDIMREKILSALLSCSSVKAAAEKAGVSPRTVYNYMNRDPTFKQRYEKEKAQLVTAATEQIQRSLSPAITALSSIAEDEAVPPAARVQAARALLEYGIRLTEIDDIYKRLDELEQSTGVSAGWRGGDYSA